MHRGTICNIYKLCLYINLYNVYIYNVYIIYAHLCIYNVYMHNLYLCIFKIKRLVVIFFPFIVQTWRSESRLTSVGFCNLQVFFQEKKFVRKIWLNVWCWWVNLHIFTLAQNHASIFSISFWNRNICNIVYNENMLLTLDSTVAWQDMAN